MALAMPKDQTTGKSQSSRKDAEAEADADIRAIP
jgi:hypothetical protein